MDILNQASKANKSAQPANDKQWVTYMSLCRSKYQEQKPREAFTMSSISEEITRLIGLPNDGVASPAQKAKFEQLCKDLGVKVPDTTGWSRNNISARIAALQKMVKASENQVKLLINYYRFGIINTIPEGINQFDASSILTEHQQDYLVVSDGRLTLGQAMKICTLEKKLHSADIDIRELSTLSFEEASEKINLLMQEEDGERQARAVLRMDVTSSTGLDMTVDGVTRSRDMENLDVTDFATKVQIYKAVKAAMSEDGRDSEDELTEANIDTVLKDLFMLADNIGYGKQVYGIVASIEGAAKKPASSTEVKDELKKKRTKKSA
jgi:hypothetical protein